MQKEEMLMERKMKYFLIFISGSIVYFGISTILELL